MSLGGHAKNLYLEQPKQKNTVTLFSLSKESECFEKYYILDSTCDFGFSPRDPERNLPKSRRLQLTYPTTLTHCYIALFYLLLSTDSQEKEQSVSSHSPYGFVSAMNTFPFANKITNLNDLEKESDSFHSKRASCIMTFSPTINFDLIFFLLYTGTRKETK